MPKPANEIILADEVIMDKIYVIRGQKIMPVRPGHPGGLDRDLAELYGVQAIRLRSCLKTIL